MRIRTLLAAVALLAALPLAAARTQVYSTYELTRQALIRSSLPDVQAYAKAMATSARAEKQPAIAAKADALAAAKDIRAARAAFAGVSDAMIAFRSADSGERPIVVYCPMEKKSWLQPKGAIANPYVAPEMRSCGQITSR